MSKLFSNITNQGWRWLLGICVAATLAGCGGVKPTPPHSPAGAAGVGTATNEMVQTDHAAPRIKEGDLVMVSFLDLPAPMRIEECRERVRDDGTLVLPYEVKVSAVGKTTTELQDIIRAAYVPRLFKRITISVKTEERFYFVGGEVKASGRFPYQGKITVLRAIDTAGGFTDFAKRTKIELHRANGETKIVNWDKAKRDSRLDVEVYPNDRINVPMRGM